MNAQMGQRGTTGLTIKERRKVLFDKLKLSGLEFWMEENKDKAMKLLAEYHDIFTLEDGKIGCTKAAEHRIEVTDPRPFKERLRNIPSGLLDEVKSISTTCLTWVPSSLVSQLGAMLSS